MNLVPIRVIEQIQKIQKKFIWNGKKPKIKHTTLINEYQDEGLKGRTIIFSGEGGLPFLGLADNFFPKNH